MDTDNEKKKRVYSEHVFFIRSSVFNHIYSFDFFFYFLPTSLVLCVDVVVFLLVCENVEKASLRRWLLLLLYWSVDVDATGFSFSCIQHVC